MKYVILFLILMSVVAIVTASNTNTDALVTTQLCIMTDDVPTYDYCELKTRIDYIKFYDYTNARDGL